MMLVIKAWQQKRVKKASELTKKEAANIIGTYYKQYLTKKQKQNRVAEALQFKKLRN